MRGMHGRVVWWVVLAMLTVSFVGCLLFQFWRTSADDTIDRVARPGFSPHIQADYDRKMRDLGREDPAATQPTTAPSLD